MRRRRAATSMVEIVMGVGIIAAALVPIAWYFVSSSRQQAALKAEAAAAGYAGKVMNQLLDEMPFDEVASGLGETDVEIDGAFVTWSIEVAGAGDLTFDWEPIPGVNATNPPAALSVIDAKNRGNEWVKDIKMTVKWRGPRDETGDDPRRTQVLCTRRARL